MGVKMGTFEEAVQRHRDDARRQEAAEAERNREAKAHADEWITGFLSSLPSAAIPLALVMLSEVRPGRTDGVFRRGRSKMHVYASTSEFVFPLGYAHWGLTLNGRLLEFRRFKNQTAVPDTAPRPASYNRTATYTPPDMHHVPGLPVGQAVAHEAGPLHYYFGWVLSPASGDPQVVVRYWDPGGGWHSDPPTWRDGAEPLLRILVTATEGYRTGRLPGDVEP